MGQNANLLLTEPALSSLMPLEQPQPFVAPVAHAPALTRRQKAAIIVRYALSQGVEIRLSGLPENLQTELVHQMSGLKVVDQATIDAVVEEFVQSFENTGLRFPQELRDTLDMMQPALSSELVMRLRKQAGLSIHSDPWSRLGEIDTDALVPVLEAESVEVAAVVLSKLKVSKSAEILGKLPGDRARRIAYAISLTGSIAPAIVTRIGHTIAEQFDASPQAAFTDGPVERVGAILNFSPASTRDEVLDGLDKDDQGFAAEVRKAIFTFANIPDRIDPRDIPKILREIDQEQLVIALAGVSGPTERSRDFIFENMSKRMAEQLQEEVREKGDVKPADAEAAMTSIVITIRELEAAGEIFLVAADEE